MPEKNKDIEVLDGKEVIELINEAICIISTKVQGLSYDDIYDIVMNFYAYNVLKFPNLAQKTRQDILNILVKICTKIALKEICRQNNIISIDNDGKSSEDNYDEDNFQNRFIITYKFLENQDEPPDINDVKIAVSFQNQELFNLLLEDKSLKEIAEILGIKYKTLCKRWEREKVRLNKIFKTNK